MNTSPWLTVKETATYLQVAERTLQDWRTRKVGPPYVKLRQQVRYHRDDLDKWIRKENQ